jgi:hypothetical protein
LSPQRRPVFCLPNLDDQLKTTLAAPLYARLVGEAQRRNVGIAQVLRSLSIKQPK